VHRQRGQCRGLREGVWAYDFTHFTRARRAVIAILDVVSRRWITTLVAAQESSTQVEVAFTNALAAEDLLAVADGRATAALRAALADGDREKVVSLTADGQCPLDREPGGELAVGARLGGVRVVGRVFDHTATARGPRASAARRLRAAPHASQRCPARR